MRVQMKRFLSGTFDGIELPGPGGEVDVPNHVGADLCAGGFAEPVVAAPAKAAAPKPEKRAQRKG